jgi:hypothetical protein
MVIAPRVRLPPGVRRLARPALQFFCCKKSGGRGLSIADYLEDSMANNDQRRGTSRLFVGGAVIAVVLGVAVTIWPLVTQNQLGTPKGGANPATTPDTTASRGAPAQSAAQSAVGKSDPAGQESNGGRAEAIKKSSEPLQLNAEQHQKVRDVIAHQPDAPKIQKAPFEMMIGTAVPKEVQLKDIPPEITQAMNGFWGDQYLLVQDELVIVDQHTRRVVAIVPAVG